ncbi:hypothetical protein DFQ09_103215 [Winogradskyella pacifica]|uniref:Uncharacterized protein n=1 Tax=Winogradskyella pacifica TaxID=664642 RepID=A0A3D9MXR1_9FLAO|nr:hypothetical protein [Winogradskyella pacifica]REE24909.1 hypothetical protein DFQ09_103215 [Winogradskyella pacifica]
MKEVKNKLSVLYIALLCSISIVTFNACSNEDETTETEEVSVTDVDDTDFEATDWTTETHRLYIFK